MNIEDRWCIHLPLLHQIAADRSQLDRFPRYSRTQGLFEACAYWETLHYLFRYLLGWRSIGLGLAWWYKNGKPVSDSSLLELVSLLWNSESQLDYYAAWVWRTEGAPLEPYPGDPRELAFQTHMKDRSWWDDFFRRADRESSNPFFGGQNPLHLGHSEGFGIEQSLVDCSELYFEIGSRKAVLVVNDIGSWRADLDRANQKLPPLEDRSWNASIFDRQAGYLGLFRKSRITQQWFQGKHRIHLTGACEL